MPVTRTIYTQGAVNLKANGVSTWFSGTALTGTNGLFLSGVQSANFTTNSPRQDVSAFGVLGTVGKVQVEPQTATLEVSLVVNSGNHGGTQGNWFTAMVNDASQPAPTGLIVTASGIGQVSGAVLTSVRLEAAVGALPTITFSFDGISGTQQTAAEAPSTPNTTTVTVMTPDNFGTLYWNNASAGITGCPQSVRASWEMPVERINCLGAPINAPTIFSRPPGTMSLTAEGVDSVFLRSGNFLTGIQVGPFKISQTSGTILEVSRSANMAVGEAVSTFNITSEGVALGATVAG